MDLLVLADGRLLAQGRWYRCALGWGGVVVAKREGDGGTPAGRYPLRELFYRPDRLPRPATRLPVRALRRHDGWCDDPDDARYNRPVRLPYPASAERLWRADALYDLLAVIGYNDDPPRPGLGSAIFLHVAPPAGRPTAGCVALPRPALLDVLHGLGPGSMVEIRGIGALAQR